jgi:short-subunit dehydrogenase
LQEAGRRDDEEVGRIDGLINNAGTTKFQNQGDL